jgi:hypothetical protein
VTDFSVPVSLLRKEFDQQNTLFSSQPTIVQRFLEGQARRIAEGLFPEAQQVRFSLPDRVVIPVRPVRQPASVSIPDSQREQRVGNPWRRKKAGRVREELLHRLRELEQSPDEALAAGGSLLRFATASYLITGLLPSGRSVTYRLEGTEEFPTIPVEDLKPESALTQVGDVIVEQGDPVTGRGELQTPFVPAARRFFLPQWVAFDQNGRLLVGTEKEADAHVRSMQRYAKILHAASALAPYMVANEDYQRRRYGILGQLVNQGRALAIFRTGEIIREIKQRAGKGSLNRGLSITMSYFDDQLLELRETRFEIIPRGRIMFVPALVVRAARDEQAKVGQDTRLNASTRKHLIDQLDMLENAFTSEKKR